MSKNKRNIKSPLLLLLAAIIWGVAFVAQSVGMEHVGPFTFNFVRSIIGGIVLLPVIWFSNKEKPTDSASLLPLIVGGISCGFFLFAASSFQQVGIQYTSVGKAGFITAFYIILVPILGIFLGKKCAPSIWIAVALSLLGLYLLCITESFSIEFGDVLIFICALLFSFHILTIDHFSPLVNGVQMACIQFFVCGILSGICALFTETIVLSDILAAWLPILYAGAFSSGIAYTLQIIGQKDMNPTVASLILSLESCIAVLAGWLLLRQQLSSRELLGCIIMFSAIILAQLPIPLKDTK